MVDTHGRGPCANRREGSTPSFGTKFRVGHRVISYVCDKTSMALTLLQQTWGCSPIKVEALSLNGNQCGFESLHPYQFRKEIK